MSKYGCALLLAATLLAAGCASTPTDGGPDTVALSNVRSFSGQPPGEALPQGWQPWILSSFKRPTSYRLVSREGKTVIRAEAQSSASGLIHPRHWIPAPGRCCSGAGRSMN